MFTNLLNTISPITPYFLARGSAGTNKVMYSEDGITWESIADTQTTKDVIWVEELSLFVAIGGTDSTSAFTSPDGKVWTERTTPTSNNGGWGKLVWSADETMLVCVAYDYSADETVMTSPDATTWTLRDPGDIDLPLSGIAYSPTLDRWVATGFSQVGGPAIIYSDNSGVAWTGVTSPNPVESVRDEIHDHGWNDVVWGNDRFVAVASDQDYTTRVMYSTDGEVWTISGPAGTAATDNRLWITIDYSPSLNLFAATGWSSDYDTNMVMTSPDGVTWTMRTTPTTGLGGGTTNTDFRAIVWSASQSLFVVVGNGYDDGTDCVMTSPNGVDWTLRTAAIDGNWRAVTTKGQGHGRLRQFNSGEEDRHDKD